LFQYLKQYLDSGISVAWEVMDQLHLEVDALNLRISGVSAFYGDSEYKCWFATRSL